MRLILFLLLAFGAGMPAAAAETPPAPADGRVGELIAALGLEYLECESGYVGLIDASHLEVIADGEKLLAQSQVYYMLTRELQVNYLHWLASDDTHILIEGGPVDYYIFHADGRSEKVTLGMNLGKGQRPVVAVPADSKKALVLHEEAPYALMANVLSPQWTKDRVKIGAGQEFLERYAGKAPWATREFLRYLIGPNWVGSTKQGCPESSPGRS